MNKLLAAMAVLALSAAPAFAASAHYLKVSPATVEVGNKVQVSGAVGNGCSTGKKGDVAIVYSKAFKGAKGVKSSAGGPAFFVSLPKNGKFSFSVTIKTSILKGTYHIGGRCGGGLFGSASLKVKNPSVPGFY
jgi:hypothetical protein